ncbi:MAG: endo-1,4-beta-xylanase [Lacipirellulaceae bacterium]
MLPLSGGFDYTFSGITQSVTANGVRLADPADGWGGAGRGLGTLDLRPYVNGRWVVDFQQNAANRVDRFGVELYDADGNSGTWTIPTWGAEAGVGQTFVTNPTLANPEFGVNNFPNLDLSRITTFNVLGQWASPDPIDVTVSSVKLSVTAPAPPPYAGYEANAPWRAEAATRIDALRKGNLSVSVIDAVGNPVPNAPVHVQQTDHEFGFGSAVQGVRIRSNSPTNKIYKQKIAELFNIAVLENDTKWPAWEGEWGGDFTKPGTQQALDWLAAQGIERRGHVLVWPGTNNLPQDLRALLSSGPLSAAQQQQLRDRITSHIADVAGATNGKITHWDVVNEPRTNNDVMDALPEGDAVMATWYQAARAAAPGAVLYLNEYDILESGGRTDSPNQVLLENQVRALQQAGAPIGGVGLQSHFNAANLTGPAQLWQILDRYDALGVDVQITELDIDTTNEALQAEYTRDFYTAMFAHESVTDVLTWGFWEGAHWRPNAAMFRNDWSIKPNGQAFLDLVHDQWWTDETLATGATGDAALRAFKGRHLVSTSLGGSNPLVATTVDGGGESIVLQLSYVVGDFNRDGAVDAADYTVWRDTLGQTVAAPGLAADGDGDGVIGPGDVAAWVANYGDRVLPSSAIPEPSAGVLAVLLVGGTQLRRRR